MKRKKKSETKKRDKGPRIAKVIWEDLNSGIFRRSVWEDIKEIYRFYVDKETRGRHESMGRLRRVMHGSWAVLKSLILKLSSFRRVLLVLSLIFSIVLGSVSFTNDNDSSRFDLRMLAYIMLLLILLLELKDKLLARDELAAGRKVQFALLPKDPPDIEGWDVWLFTRPANEVGGDLVDYLKMDGGRLGMVLGDVAGKGLGAALYMAKLQAVWRLLAPDIKSVATLGQRMNLSFCRDGLPNRFVSLIYLDIHEDSGRIYLMNAGHMPALIWKERKVTECALGGTALGLSDKSEYREEIFDLNSDELIMLYSDGLTEARNRQGEFFGEPLLMESLRASAGLNVEEVGRAILADVDAFIGDEKASDDLSMIIIKRR